MSPAVFYNDDRVIDGAVRGSAVFKITLEHHREKYELNIFFRDPSEAVGWSYISDVYDSYTAAKAAYDEELRKYHFIDDNQQPGKNADDNEDIPII